MTVFVHNSPRARLPVVLALAALGVGACLADPAAPPVAAPVTAPHANEVDRLYSKLLEAATPAARRELTTAQRDWRAGPACAGPCLSTRTEQQLKQLHALAARVSAANPSLPDASAAWLEGRWRVGAIVGPPGFVMPRRVPELPRPGSEFSTRAGERCTGPQACGDFGLEPQLLGGDASRADLARLLGVPADSPLYVVYQDGSATYSLVPSPRGTLLAVAEACSPGGDPCGYVWQEWTGTAADAVLVRPPAR